MNNENEDVTQESSPEEEEVVEGTETEEEFVPPVRDDEKTPTVSVPPKKTETNTVPYSRFKEVNDELAKLKNRPVESTKSLEVDDFINISASLEGLNQAEKSYLAEQHKLTGKPLSEIRNSENFLLWQSGYHAKVEKERALKPNSAQPDGDAPRTLSGEISRLNNGTNFKANLEQQEKLLQEAGLYKAPKVNPHRTSI